MAQTSLEKVGLRPPHTESLNAVLGLPFSPRVSTRPTSPVLFQEKTKGVPAMPPCGPSSKKLAFFPQGEDTKAILNPELPQPSTSALAASSPGGAPRPSLAYNLALTFSLPGTNSFLFLPQSRPSQAFQASSKPTPVALTS